jgi:hypothetical protein
MRPHGRAQVSATNPQAFARCDRCGFWVNHVNLRAQFQYSGTRLYNTNILVCDECLDIPQEQLKTIILPPDPVPIMNARPEQFVNAETDYRIANVVTVVDPVTGIPMTSGDTRVTQANASRVPQQTGEPPGGLNEEPGTSFEVPGNDDPGLPYENTSVPRTGPLT